MDPQYDSEGRRRVRVSAEVESGHSRLSTSKVQSDINVFKRRIEQFLSDVDIRRNVNGEHDAQAQD